MVTLLLADTDPRVSKTIHQVENICHTVGLGVLVHHKGEDINELLDSAEGKIIAFSPQGHLSLDEMIDKYKGDVLLVVGGFEEDKDFDSNIYPRTHDTVSLGSDFLPIPTVIEKILEGYERKAKGRGAGDR